MTIPTEEEIQKLREESNKGFRLGLDSLRGVELIDSIPILTELLAEATGSKNEHPGEVGELRATCLHIAVRYQYERLELAKKIAKQPATTRMAAHNRLDLDFCGRYLAAVVALLGAHPATSMLSRLQNAITDLLAGTRPMLFFDIAQPTARRGNARGRSVAASAQAEAAFILDLLMKSKTQADAIKWIDTECERLRLVDSMGKILTGSRFKNWRSEFTRGKGAGRHAYQPVERFLNAYTPELIDETLGAGAVAVLRAPASKIRNARIEEIARERLKFLARCHNREFPPLETRERRRK